MQIAEREQTLRTASAAYYQLEAPIMTDREFDLLWAEHLAARDAAPDDPNWQDTILDKVGAGPAAQSGFAKVAHNVPMMSLDNVFVGDDGSIDEIEAWVNKLPAETLIILEPKIDGLSLRLNYVDSVLISAVTRGDGTVGDDVTANVLAAGMVPARLWRPTIGPLAINGEAFMNFTNFEAVNAALAAVGEDLYANPRNAAAGMMRRKDPSQVKGLSFFAHGVAVGAVERSYGYEQERLEGLGLRVPIHGVLRVGDVASRLSLAGLKEMVEGCKFPVDGVVMKIANFTKQEQMGCTSRAPKWAVAVKFQQEEVETTLKSITVQVGRSGVLTPVAELEPVYVDGSTVSRASLHNEDQVNRLGLYEGARVRVQKAGAIIPAVLGLADEQTVNRKTEG